VDWERLATAVDTLVILMGVGALPRIAARLLAAGRGVDTPAAVIHRGTTEMEETVVGTLGDIAARAARLQAPAVIVIGEAVAFRALLARSLLDPVALDRR
jgi:siroheme synthase